MIETRVEIMAPQALVWEILTDFERYGEWNSYIPSIQGAAAAGSTIELVAMEGPSGEGLTKSVRIEALEPYMMVWLGGTEDPSLFQGTHFFEVEVDSQGHSLFLHREFFTGRLAAELINQFRAPIVANFEIFNACLKRAAEQVRSAT